jgi:hypothetical protein
MSAAVETWTCSRCGAVNKPSWRFCARCEAMADGSRRADHLPKPGRNPDQAVLPGLLLLAGLVAVAVGAALYGSEAWDAVASLVP